MKNPLIAVAIAMAVLTGCDAEGTSRPDQCLRAKIFTDCLKNAPTGPKQTKYNDWDDVVDSCEQAAYYQSRRHILTINPECRP